ncbi:MAG: metal ABC transporter permease [Bilophila wadsworthia]
MLDLEPLYRLVSLLPFECLQAGFMQQALVALILLAPMAATMGVQVVSFRMAFFSDAISHSAFAGVALGLIFSINPHVAMPVFGILVGLGIMAVQRNSALSSDTIIGVFFSAVMAFGLAVVSRDNAVARDLQQFLYGDILTITETDIRWLIGLFFALAAAQIWGYNRPLYIGLNSVVAKAHRINVFFWQYLRRAARACRDVLRLGRGRPLRRRCSSPAATARNLPARPGACFGGRSSSASLPPWPLVLSAQEWRDSHRSDRCPRLLRLVPAERRSRRHTGRGTAPVTLS